MQFSNTTTNLGIVQEYERITGQGLTTVSGTATLLDECVSLCNQAISQVWHEIFMAYGGWQFDDDNQSDLPSAIADLASGTGGYALPTGAVSVRHVEVQNSGGDWVRLSPISQEQILEVSAVREFQSTNGMPLYYSLVGSTVQLHPAPNYSVTGGLAVYFDRDMVAFADTDTTATPGFASPYHNVIPLLAAFSWLMVNKPNDKVTDRTEKRSMERLKELKSFYAKRWEHMNRPRISVSDSVRRYS